MPFIKAYLFPDINGLHFHAIFCQFCFYGSQG